MRESDTFGWYRIERRAADLARRLRLQDDSIRLGHVLPIGRPVIPDSVLTKVMSNHELAGGARHDACDSGEQCHDSATSLSSSASVPSSTGRIRTTTAQDFCSTTRRSNHSVASRIIRVARDFERLIEEGLNSTRLSFGSTRRTVGMTPPS